MTVLIGLAVMLFPSLLGAFVGVYLRSANDTYLNMRQLTSAFMASALLASFVGYFVTLFLSIIIPWLNTGDGTIFKMVVYAFLGYVGNETLFKYTIRYIEKNFLKKYDLDDKSNKESETKDETMTKPNADNIIKEDDALDSFIEK